MELVRALAVVIYGPLKTCQAGSESVNLKMLPPKNKPRGRDWDRAIFSKDVGLSK